MALLAGAMFAACGDDDNDGDSKGPDEGDVPPVEVTSDVKGVIKAGIADAIEITGSGFEDGDYIYIGYDKDGAMAYERVSPDVLILKATRISFGVSIGASYLDKTVKVYLDRLGYKDRKALTGDITFTMPSVEEGYIPDAGLRATLSSKDEVSGNPTIAPLFSTLGLLDVQAAANVKSINLYACQARTLDGIELFKNATFVSGWDMPNVKEIDLSNWTAKGIDLRFERALSLEKFIGAPYSVVTTCYGCPKLTYVDVHNCNWLRSLDISNFSDKTGPASAVTYLDIRRNQSGAYQDNPAEETDYTIWGGDSGFKVADNATILVDSWFIFDHNYGTGGCWDNIYDAWKNRGATIKVYSRVEPYIDVLLGTVPMSSVDPEALSPSSHNSGKPTNKWQIDDPNTEYNEGPVPYVPPGK